jgi:hypothetical protein
MDNEGILVIEYLNNRDNGKKLRGYVSRGLEVQTVL